ncbi:glycerate kinase [Xylophilus sp.]|uniref:glycerate kinase n=1 Tax=Xylophilus sp. TaxID=2653893 RepID=UPI0013BB7FF7|nr:glycerate kinase [Xylophilus sp.]KAF1050313.1 MAG: hypothetical protein GAK38_00339 [Xylophilus sp.]
MDFRKLLIPLGIVLLVGVAWRSMGWQGVLAVSGGLLMWALLHYTRVVKVMGRAADRPVGYVDSAVMLNARLKPGVNLLHVITLTKALGLRRSAEGEEPEVYRWTDGSDSHVTAEFIHGRLQRWKLERPAQVEEAAAAPAADAP